MRSKSSLVLAALLAASIVLTACDSGSSSTNDGGGGSFDPKVAAGKLRARGGVQTAGRTTLGNKAGPISGRIAYSPYRVRSQVTVSTGTDLARIGYLRIGDRAWIRRPVLPAKIKPTSLGLGLATIVFRGASAAPYLPLESPDTGLVAYLGTPFDPARLLDAAAAQKVRFRSAGSSDVDGTSRDRFAARIGVAQARVLGVRSLDVWVDSAGIPVQVRFRGSLEGTSTYGIRRLTGGVVVQAPPAAQVVVTNQPLPDATGPYLPALDATAGTVPVRILTAPGAKDWTCWKVESNPPFVNISEPRPSGGYCVVPIQTRGSVDEQFIIPLDASADAPYELLGLVVPPASTVEFSRFGAAPVTVIAGMNGLAAYVGPTNPVVGLATVTTPDHQILVCAPGTVNNAEDFRALEDDPSGQAALRGEPWNCLPKDLADLLSS